MNKDLLAGFIISKAKVGDNDTYVLDTNTRFSYPFRAKDSWEQTYNRIFVGEAGKMSEWKDPGNPELGVGNLRGAYRLGEQEIPSRGVWTGKGAQLIDAKGKLHTVDLKMDSDLQATMKAINYHRKPESELDPKKVARLKEVLGAELYARLAPTPAPFPCDPFVLQQEQDKKETHN